MEGCNKERGVGGDFDGSEGISSWEEYWEKFGHGLIWQGWLELHPEFGEEESSSYTQEGCLHTEIGREPSGMLIKTSGEKEDGGLDMHVKCNQEHDLGVNILLESCQDKDIITEAAHLSEKMEQPCHGFEGTDQPSSPFQKNGGGQLTNMDEADSEVNVVQSGEPLRPSADLTVPRTKSLEPKTDLIIDSLGDQPGKQHESTAEGYTGNAVHIPLSSIDQTCPTLQNGKVENHAGDVVEEKDLSGGKMDKSQDAALAVSESKWTPELIEEWDKHSDDTYWYYHHWFHSWQNVLQGEEGAIAAGEEIPQENLIGADGFVKGEENEGVASSCDQKVNASTLLEEQIPGECKLVDDVEKAARVEPKKEDASTLLQEHIPDRPDRSTLGDLLANCKLVDDEEKAVDVEPEPDQHEDEPGHNLEEEIKMVFPDDEESDMMKQMGLPSGFGKDVPQGREVGKRFL